MTTERRNVEQIVREIEQEREQLARAVSQLRTELRKQAPRAVASAVVVGGAVLAAKFALRRRYGVVRARFGRYTVVER